MWTVGGLLTTIDYRPTTNDRSTTSSNQNPVE